MHLYAPRAQLLHLNPSHWDGAPVPESSQPENSPVPGHRGCSSAAPALPASGKYLPFLLKFTFVFRTPLGGLGNACCPALCSEGHRGPGRCTAVEPLLRSFNEASTPL